MRKLTEKQKHWQEIIENWQRSGLSQVEYCRRSDIELKLFYRWKSTLDKRSKGNEAATKSDFVEFAIDTGSSEKSDEPVTIKINNAELTLKSNTDLDLFSKAIKLLREAS